MNNIVWKAIDPNTFDLITICNGVVTSRTSSPDKICNYLKQFHSLRKASNGNNNS